MGSLCFFIQFHCLQKYLGIIHFLQDLPIILNKKVLLYYCYESHNYR